MAITIREVAKEAGVSASTVSYVLAQRPGRTISTATRERVLNAARRLDYRYNANAADLRRGATHMVGIHLYSLTVPILARKVDALQRGLREAGLYPFLCYATDPDVEQAFFKECVSRRVAGIVLTGRPLPESHRYLVRLQEERAVVVSAVANSELNVPHVTVDLAGGIKMAVRHLLTLGHRRIAAVIGFTGRGGERLREGYRRALARAGVAFDARLLVDVPGDRTSEYEAGGRVIEQFLGLPEPPTAVFVSDDMVALGALWTAQRRGLRVPEDLALIGCDDLPVAAHANVPLTTLAQPAEEQGTRLAQLFREGLEDREKIASCRVALPMQLVIRASCGGRR